MTGRVRVDPLFFVVALLIGYLWTQSLTGALLVLVAIGATLFIHELGHASLAALWGLRPSITLGMLGGVTHYLKPSSFWKELGVLAGGALAGAFFFMFIVAIRLFPWQNPVLVEGLFILEWVNFFWTVFNLLPVLPLDGGQILFLVLDRWFPNKGALYASFCSAFLSLTLALFFLFRGGYLLGILFLYCFYESYQTGQQRR